MAISPRSDPFPYPYPAPTSQFGECFRERSAVKLNLSTKLPNQKNIYGASLALIAILYGIIGIMFPGNGKDQQWYMSGIPDKCNSYHYSNLAYQPYTDNKLSLSKSNHRKPSLSISGYDINMAGKSITTVAHVRNPRHVQLILLQFNWRVK